MKINTWPGPTGPCTIGTTSTFLTDYARNSHLLSDDNGREILIRTWYPADPGVAATGERERLWQDMHSDPTVPGLMKLLLRGTLKILTNSYLNGRFAAEAGLANILIYNHGLISFAAENTWLMEDLASHGFIVIAIQHKEQLAEFKALQQAQSSDERKRHGNIEKRLRKLKGEERAQLSREYYRTAANSNRIVAARAEDTAFVLDHVNAVMEAIPGIGDNEPGIAKVGLIGLSLGGAVSTEFVKSDARGGFVVNMDGGMYGMLQERPVSSPCLMLYSHANDGCNALSLIPEHPATLECRTIEHTRHLNFHEISMIYRALRWLGATGSANPLDVLSLRNQYIIDFVKANI